MPRFVLDAVIGHAEQLGLGDRDMLCRTPRGTLLPRDYYNSQIWTPAITAARLPADTTFHDMRHTFRQHGASRRHPDLGGFPLARP
jgi:integrase